MLFTKYNPVVPSNVLPGMYSIPIEAGCQFKGAQHFSS